jgi:iron complex outermembrane receptor protein
VTLGATYRPRFVRDLEVSVDAWRVSLSDALAGMSLQQILDRCILDGDPLFCTPDDPNFHFERGPDGMLTAMRTGLFNLAEVRVSGADVAASYRYDTAAHGSLQARFNATRTHEALQTVTGGAPAVNLTGRALGALSSPTWRWRGNTTLDWYYGDVAFTWTMRFMSSLWEPCDGLFPTLHTLGLAERELCSNPSIAFGGGHNRVPAIVYHDMSVAWRAPWSAGLRVGARNLFDNGPPFMTTPASHSFDHAYDLPGPFWFASYRQAF